MQMPKPTEAHQKLQLLVGEWEGEEKMEPSPWAPEGGVATARFQNHLLDGLFLISDYQQLRDGEVTFRGHGIYGWHAKDERYTMYWVDSMGTPANQAAGKWEGDSLTFEHRSPMGHHRYFYEVGADQFRFEISFSKDGNEWASFMSGTYRRLKR